MTRIPSPVSELRHPRAIVLINGIRVLWTEIEVTTTTFYLADNFKIELPLSNQPSPLNLNYWASAPQFVVQIYIGFPNNPNNYSEQDLDLIIVGDADDIEIDPLSSRIHLNGRDYTSRLIDNKTTEKFPEQFSSTIATELAKENNLTPVVTQTNTPVGNYFQNGQSLLTGQNTQWDLLTFLAQQENFVAYVQGTQLIFKPRPTELSEAFLITYQYANNQNRSATFPGMGLGLMRSLTIAQDVKVTVQVPFNPLTGKAFSKTASSKHIKRSSLRGLPLPNNKKQTYVQVIPGLTPEQALQKAQQILRDITIHENRIVIHMPGNNFLKKDTPIQLAGTQSSFDQIYFADQVTRRISVDGGYDMEIQAKNHSPDSEVTLK